MKPRTNELRARCSEEEKQALKLLAEYEGIPSTDMLRSLVREAAQKRGLWRKIIDGNGNQPAI